MSALASSSSPPEPLTSPERPSRPPRKNPPVSSLRPEYLPPAPEATSSLSRTHAPTGFAGGPSPHKHHPRLHQHHPLPHGRAAPFVENSVLSGLSPKYM